MRQYIIHAILFVVVLITTTLAGAEWISGKFLFIPETEFSWRDFFNAMAFSVPFIGILTVHEFGHYFTAQWHRVKVTLPYYMPFWFGFLPLIGLPPIPSIGTMGAFIRIKERLTTREQFFDIGIAGPLAGFAVAIGVLYYGFTHLPPPEYIYEIHPEYQEYGLDYAKYVYQDIEGSFRLGSNLTFMFFEQFVVTQPDLIPNSYELIHYPWLFAGYLALFFTALNLLPIGQLDGGHILYGLVGNKTFRVISAVLFLLFVTYAGLGIISPFDPLDDLLWAIPLYVGFLYFVLTGLDPEPQNRLVIALGIFTLQFLLVYFDPGLRGYQGWLVFALLIGRFLGVYHPPAMQDEPLDTNRKILGWISLIVFLISFSPQPFIFD